MREYLSSMDHEEFDQVVYPQMVTGHMVGQKEMFTDDILLMPNPERYTPEPPHEVTVSEIQRSITGWETSLPMPADHNHPRKRMKGAIGELKELREAINNYDGTPQTAVEVADEAVDEIIRMIGIIGSVNMDAGCVISNKLKVIHKKYNVAEHQQLRAKGMGYEQAMSHQKGKYGKP